MENFKKILWKQLGNSVTQKFKTFYNQYQFDNLEKKYYLALLRLRLKLLQLNLRISLFHAFRQQQSTLQRNKASTPLLE